MLPSSPVEKASCGVPGYSCFMAAPITRAILAYHLFWPASSATPVSRSRERKYSSSSRLHLPRPGNVYSSWSNQLKKKNRKSRGESSLLPMFSMAWRVSS